MTLTLEPETGILLEDNPLPVDLKDRVEAAANTAKDLEKHGLSLEPNKEDKDVTARISTVYSGDPEDVYVFAQQQMKDIYNLDIPMDIVKQWADNYHFPYSREQDPNDEDQLGPMVYDFATEERGDFLEWLKDNNLAEGKLLKEFRRTGRQYKAQGQGGSAGNRRPGIMRGPRDIEDDDEEYTSKGDPNIDKGDFYDYSPYGFTIRFLGYEDGDDVIVRGNGFFSEKVKNGKVTFKSYPMKDAQGNRLEDAQGNRPGTPNSTYKLSDNYNKNQIADVLGNDHPFVVMTKSNHWKNNHSIDIDDNSISITLDTPNNLPGSLAPLKENTMKNLKKEASKLGYLNDGSYIEVNPIELMGNAIENTDNPVLMQQFQALIKNL